jgi:oxygen-independent coproporphyrinogen-3 oxidase
VRASALRHVYIHVPFCARKCEYCAFYSEANSAELADRYVASLLREFELVSPSLAASPATLFFGGGTPTLLSLRQWETVLAALHRHFSTPPGEWTVECNPATLSLEKARLLRAGGVNRISMGVQSLDEALLDRLGRVHSRPMVFRSYETLRRAGFENVNLDLMFGIPGQTMDMWRRTLREAIQLQPEHLSCYEVIYEEDTPLFEQLRAGEFDVDEDLACGMYEELRSTLADSGFEQYEIANFARRASPGSGSLPAFACQHNVMYWRGRPFEGLGPSASRFVGGERARNWSNTRLYCESLEHHLRPTESVDRLSALRRAGEIAGIGLRMIRGWDYEEFRATTGFDLREHWQDEIAELTEIGWAASDEHRLGLTEVGLRFADAAAQRFLRS